MNCEIEKLSAKSNIFLAGHRGMVGSALYRLLNNCGYENILTRTSRELDLTDQQAVRVFFRAQRVDCVILAAARVGGIQANYQYPAEFIYQNQMIQNNVIHQAYRTGVKRLLFLGSSCIYPKYAPQPMREEHLLSGVLEETNEPYAIAKISGIKMCEAYNHQYSTDFRAVMPTNLYGPGDNFHLENSHVIPAIMRKYHLAKLAAEGDYQSIEQDQNRFGQIPHDIAEALYFTTERSGNTPYVKLWGSGEARREFLHVEDMASACLYVLNLPRKTYSQGLTVLPGSDGSANDEAALRAPSFYNIGTGKDCTISEVAEKIRKIVGYTGETRYNRDQPDGTPRKLLDTSRINNLGWQPSCNLTDGLRSTYEWYCAGTGKGA